MATEGDPDLGNAARNYADLPRDQDVKKFDFNTEETRQKEEHLLQALRDAKPSALTDGFGVRGRQPAERQTLNEVRRTDAPLGSITRRQDVPDFASTTATQTTEETTASTFPWQVTTSTFANQQVLKVAVGMVGNSVPVTTAFVPLDSQSTINPPVIYPHATDFNIWLKVKIILQSPSTIAWHPRIGDTGDIPMVIDFEPPNPPNETTPVDFRMIFDPPSPAQATSGTFYVRIARVFINLTTGKVRSVQQYLRENLRSIALAGNDVVAF